MSRIGNKLINLPEGVDIKIDGAVIVVSGKLGSLTIASHPRISVSVADQKASVERHSNDRESRALHGLYRSLIANAVTGVTEGFSKQLELIGVGYRASSNGSDLELNVGFSHPVKMKAPEGITFMVEKNTFVTVKGIDKQMVGQLSAEIRKVRPPEPYKGKGIKYSDEIIKRKAGKTAKAGA